MTEPFILLLDGSLTVAHAPEIRGKVSQSLDDHPSLTADVSAADDVDLALLQILLSADRTAKASGKAFHVASPLDGAVYLGFASAGIAPSSQPARAEAAPAPTAAAASSAQRTGETPSAWATGASDLDPKALEALVKEIGPAAVEESLDVFFAEIDERVGALRRLTVRADLPVILREAHSIKGTAGTFGLRRLSAYGAELERAAPALDSEAYAQMLARIEATVAGAREALRTSTLLAA